VSAHWYSPADTAGGVERAVSTFRRSYDAAPDGVWAAPGRVNVIGEHVDYNAGRCLPIALPHRTFCAVRRRTDGVLTIRSGQGYPSWSGSVDALHGHAAVDDRGEVGRAAKRSGAGELGRRAQAACTPSEPEPIVEWARYVAGAVWALSRAGADVPGLDVVVESDVPIGAGLSSSAALICATALAAAELSGWDDPDSLTDLCVDAETKFVGAPTGGMDQAVALRAEAGRALLLDSRDGSVEQLPFNLAAAGLALLVIDTRVTHSNVDGRYGERRRMCERSARLLGVCTLRDVADATVSTSVDDALRPLLGDESFSVARHVVTEMHRVDAAVAELRAGRVDRLGPLLDASHESLRDDFRVSCLELDLAVDEAVKAGAPGARMTGGGFGGSAIALVPTSEVTTVASAIDAAFSTAGLRQPSFLTAVAADPGARVA
jgi:galactokinase